MDESHKSNAERKKPDTRVYTIWLLLYKAHKHRKNSSVLLEVRIVAILDGREKANNCKEA